MPQALAVFGWVVLVLLSLAFLASGALCAIGASDKPQRQAWQGLAAGAVFAAISLKTFPF